MTAFRALLAALALLLATVVQAQPAASYPNHGVKIIVPFLPGGAVDSVARVLAQRLSEQTGQPFIVENRGGANGVIGSDLVAKAASDGYTLLVQATTLILNPLLTRSSPYDVVRDFTPIALLGTVPMVFSAHPGLPVANLAEFLALARANPDRYSLGVASLGSPGHLAEEAILHQAQIKVQVVSYKGTAGVLNDLIGGHLSGSVDALPAYLAHIRAGKLRALAVTTAHRIPALKDVPTVAESGLPGFDMASWYGLWGPARMPPQVVSSLAREAAAAIRSPQSNERLAEQGFDASGLGPEEFARWITTDLARFSTLVRDANIVIEGN